MMNYYMNMLLTFFLALNAVMVCAWTPPKTKLSRKSRVVQQPPQHNKHHFTLLKSTVTDQLSLNEEEPLVVNGANTTVASLTTVNQADAPATTNLPLSLEQVKKPASIFAATVGTFILNNYFSMGPVQASSVTSLISALVLPEKLALAAMCGSFAGMAKVAVIPGLGASAFLGLVCASTMALFDRQKWLVGVGGRLGFIAQCACTSQYVLCRAILPILSTKNAAAALVGPYPKFGSLMMQVPMVSLFTVLGAFSMRLWKEKMPNYSKRVAKLSNSVGAVGVTGLLASILLPASAAGPAFCGSFVAMSAPTKLSTSKALFLASVLAAVSQQSLAGVLLGGWGGKLGTAALMGVIAHIFLAKSISLASNFVMNRKKIL